MLEKLTFEEGERQGVAGRWLVWMNGVRDLGDCGRKGLVTPLLYAASTTSTTNSILHQSVPNNLKYKYVFLVNQGL